MGFITTNRLSRVISVPIAMAQTELRANKSLEVAIMPLELGQRLFLQSLTLHVVKILTPGEAPELNNAALGVASVHWLFGSMLTGSLAYAKCDTVGSATTNLFTRAVAATPGIYRVVVANNTNNLGLSVVVTGSAKIYL